MKLPVTSLLGPLVAEHRTRGPEPLLLVVQQSVLDCGTDESGRRLGSQAQPVAATVLEAVHLLLDDVGVLADRAVEELGVLEERYAHFAVTVVGEKPARRSLDPLPVRQLVREQVVHTANGLEFAFHGLVSRHPPCDRCGGSYGEDREGRDPPPAQARPSDWGAV